MFYIPQDERLLSNYYISYFVHKNDAGFWQVRFVLWRKGFNRNHIHRKDTVKCHKQFKTEQLARRYANKRLKHHRTIYPVTMYIVGEYTRSISNPVGYFILPEDTEIGRKVKWSR